LLIVLRGTILEFIPLKMVRIQCQNPWIMIGISGDCEENCSTITVASRRRPRSPTLEEENDLSRRTRRHVSNEEGCVADASGPALGMDLEL
jgi:hypothetical protein